MTLTTVTPTKPLDLNTGGRGATLYFFFGSTAVFLFVFFSTFLSTFEIFYPQRYYCTMPSMSAAGNVEAIPSGSLFKDVTCPLLGGTAHRLMPRDKLYCRTLIGESNTYFLKKLKVVL